MLISISEKCILCCLDGFFKLWYVINETVASIDIHPWNLLRSKYVYTEMTWLEIDLNYLLQPTSSEIHVNYLVRDSINKQFILINMLLSDALIITFLYFIVVGSLS